MSPFVLNLEDFIVLAEQAFHGFDVGQKRADNAYAKKVRKPRCGEGSLVGGIAS